MIKHKTKVIIEGRKNKKVWKLDLFFCLTEINKIGNAKKNTTS